jgi:exosortase
MILWILGGFLWVCGRKAFKRALFPLLFLAFMIPLPSPVLDPMVTILQSGSAWSAKAILQLLAVPVHSNGVFISLPGVTIEVAKECSGIRSAVALLVLSTFAGYLYLRTNRRRCIFVLSVIPIAIVKNGMRIATLSLLGTYVDIHYLTDSVLHRYGGKPFFLVAIVMLAPIFWVLKRSEIKSGDDTDAAATKSPLGKNLETSNDIPIVS